MPETFLTAEEHMLFESGKTYTDSTGLSCCFRQWRAKSHCRFFHGYSLQVTFIFRSYKLTDENWVMDFGGLKAIKEWLIEHFDHKTLVAHDDPEYSTIIQLAEKGILDPVKVEHVGCEAFAKMIHIAATNILNRNTSYVWIECTEVREHSGNFARYRRSH